MAEPKTASTRSGPRLAELLDVEASDLLADTTARAVLRRQGRRRAKAPPRRMPPSARSISTNTASGGTPDAGPQSRRRLTSAPLTDGTPSRSSPVAANPRARRHRLTVAVTAASRSRAADDPGYSWGGSPDCSSPEQTGRPMPTVTAPGSHRPHVGRDRSPCATRRHGQLPRRLHRRRGRFVVVSLRGVGRWWTCSPWSRVRLHVFADLALPLLVLGCRPPLSRGVTARTSRFRAEQVPWMRENQPPSRAWAIRRAGLLQAGVDQGFGSRVDRGHDGQQHPGRQRAGFDHLRRCRPAQRNTTGPSSVTAIGGACGGYVQSAQGVPAAVRSSAASIPPVGEVGVDHRQPAFRGVHEHGDLLDR